MKYLKQYIRRVIRESYENAEDHLGAVTWIEGPRRNAVIYDTRMLPRVPELLYRMEKGWDGLRMSLCDNVIKGMIDVGPWRGRGGRCNGAWMVYRSAGPDMGKVVYSVGYALSPTGRLMSDRISVTPEASAAWASVARKPEYKKLPLDDEDAHGEGGTSTYDHPNHTEDPIDDCTMYNPEPDGSPEDFPHLQNAYQGTGDEETLLSLLRHNSDTCLADSFTGREREVEHLLMSCGGLFFSRHYEP
jgi:hypothetical protein